MHPAPTKHADEDAARQLAESRGSAFDLAAALVLAVLTLVVALTFRAYGVTHDESVHQTYGNYVLRFYDSGFTELRALTYRIDYLYGGGFDASASIFRRLVSPWLGQYDAVHLFGALVGVLGVAGAWRLARSLGGPRAGFLATLMLATTSVYYGHCFNNPKDLPFAVGYVWGLHFVIAVVRQLPRIRRGTAIKATVALGLAMSVRIGGLLLLCYLGLALVLWATHRGKVRGSVAAGWLGLRASLPRVAAISLGAWAIMLVAWPWALLRPFTRPFAALGNMSHFMAHERWMPFAGREVHSLEPPSDYLIHYFGLKLPEYLVIGFLVASAFAVLTPFIRRSRGRSLAGLAAPGLVMLAIWFPPIYAAVIDSPLYDGLRHFLFLVPPIVVIVALGVDAVFSRMAQRRGRSASIVGWLLLCVLIGDQAATMARLHPHQYVYFNRFVGGLSGASELYSTDYYAETYKESTRALQRELWDQEPAAYLRTVYRVSGCIGQERVERNLPSNFEWRPQGAASDFSVNYTRGGCADRFRQHPTIVGVERDGAVLNVAYDLRTTPVRNSATRSDNQGE